MKNRKLLKTIVLIVITLTLCSVLLYGCDDNNSTIAIDNDSSVDIGKENIDKYHAKLYVPEKSWFKKEFLDNNWTAGMLIEGETDEIYGFPIEGTSFYASDSYPKRRTFIIKSKEDYEKIFLDSTFEINFETQMILLMLETNIYAISKEFTYLSGIEEQGSNLCIKYSNTLGFFGDSATAPMQKYIAVITDAIYIENVTFEHPTPPWIS